MAHTENIFICITVPLLISLFFIKGKQRSFTMFICIGMSICMASAYVNSFFMTMYGADAVSTAIQIAPVCEEIMKLLPLLFFILIFEPRPGEIIPAAIAIAAGFATFENVCYLSENGAGDIALLLVRGVSAGALHILCGIAMGYGIAYVFKQHWLAAAGTLGILGANIVFHAIYNLLVTSDSAWQEVGYIFPSLLILCIFVLKGLLPKINLRLE